MILHKAEAKLRMSVNIRDVLRLQVGITIFYSVHAFNVTTDLLGFSWHQQFSFDLYHGLMYMAWSIC